MITALATFWKNFSAKKLVFQDIQDKMRSMPSLQHLCHALSKHNLLPGVGNRKSLHKTIHRSTRVHVWSLPSENLTMFPTTNSTSNKLKINFIATLFSILLIEFMRRTLFQKSISRPSSPPRVRQQGVQLAPHVLVASNSPREKKTYVFSMSKNFYICI